MSDEKMLHSHSENLPVLDIRKLKELQHTLDMMLTEKEFLQIISVYSSVILRLLTENGEEI